MPRLYVATVGDGLYRSDDRGATWARDPGIPSDAKLYSLCTAPDGLLVGVEDAVYRYARGAWSRLALPGSGRTVWALAVMDGLILAGTRPLGFLRSQDGGRTWEEIPFRLPSGIPEPHTPRITTLLPNPGVAHEVWAGVEVGGVFTSGDGGASWSPVNEGIPSLDIHSLAWTSRGILLAATPQGVAVWRSARWVEGLFEPEDRYCRALAGRPDAPGTVYCGFGDGPPGSRGGVAVSSDGGRSWRACPFPVDSGSTIWSVSAARDVAGLVLAGSIRGKVFVSHDGGTTWGLAVTAAAEARAVACVPD
jgi:photosystem II stability/assembly factor-like uncharacterized protein